jgi:hypothetical protein
LVIAPSGAANGVETVAEPAPQWERDALTLRDKARLAGLPRPSGKPVLQLSEADVLRKTVTLPLAAERHCRCSPEMMRRHSAPTKSSGTTP